MAAKLINLRLYDLVKTGCCYLYLQPAIVQISALEEKLGSHQMGNKEIFSAEFDGQHCKGLFENGIDAGGQRVGEIVSLVDVTSKTPFSSTVACAEFVQSRKKCLQ